jgi:hypothetical protein
VIPCGSGNIESAFDWIDCIDVMYCRLTVRRLQLDTSLDTT